MDRISKGSMEEVWIKSEPLDVLLYIKSEEEVKTEPPKFAVTSNPEKEIEVVSIKSETQSDDFECVASSISSLHTNAPLQLKNKKPKKPGFGSEQRKNSEGNQLECDECGKKFSRKSNLNRHKSLHANEENLLVCDLCGKTFRGKATLTVHMRSHSGSKPFACDACGAKFTRKSTLKHHQQSTHSGKRPFICEECGKTFALKASLKSHSLTHTGEKRFACDVCEMKFSKRSSLARHKQTHNGEKQFSCEDCGKTFTQKPTLTVHRLTHSGEKRFACDICGMRFSMKYSLTSHNLTHTGERRFPCEQCGKGFTKQCHLDTHKLQHSGERPFKCDECGMGFTIKLYLKTHKLKHSGEKPFGCDECSSRFGTRSLLNQHKRIHSKTSTTTKRTLSRNVALQQSTNDAKQESISGSSSVDDFDCHTFEESSSPKTKQPESVVSDIEDQVKTHLIADQQMVPSDEFGKSFVDEFIEMHQRTHPYIGQNLVVKRKNGDKVQGKPIYKRRPRHVEKPFSCSDCEQKFATVSRLKIHQRTHTGENQHVCDECGNSFNRRDSLVNHQKRVHAGAKRFACDICGMEFFQKSQFNVHMKRHNGVKSICCDECPSKFVRTSELIQHKQHLHRKKAEVIV